MVQLRHLQATRKDGCFSLYCSQAFTSAVLATSSSTARVYLLAGMATKSQKRGGAALIRPLSHGCTRVFFRRKTVSCAAHASTSQDRVSGRSSCRTLTSRW